ncbi:unnamed protein product [Ectocarpus fasciculatus]
MFESHNPVQGDAVIPAFLILSTSVCYSTPPTHRRLLAGRQAGNLLATTTNNKMPSILEKKNITTTAVQPRQLTGDFDERGCTLWTGAAKPTLFPCGRSPSNFRNNLFI